MNSPYNAFGLIGIAAVAAMLGGWSGWAAYEEVQKVQAYEALYCGPPEEMARVMDEDRGHGQLLTGETEDGAKVTMWIGRNDNTFTVLEDREGLSCATYNVTLAEEPKVSIRYAMSLLF